MLCELFFKALLIDCLKKPASHFSIHLEYGALYFVTLVFMQNIVIHLFVLFVLFVDKFVLKFSGFCL